jgi:hypothetical protein
VERKQTIIDAAISEKEKNFLYGSMADVKNDQNSMKKALTRLHAKV